jgi:hypothetical protein
LFDNSELCSIFAEVLCYNRLQIKQEKHTKAKNMKQIKITPEERRRLQERFQVGDSYMIDVLAFRKNGPTAERIRMAALELGGRYVDPNFAPNCQTTYFGGCIYQTFGDDVVLRIEIASSNVTLSHHGEVVEKEENATMTIWNAMANKAQALAQKSMIRP